MSTLKSYQDLEVWKKSIDLAETETFLILAERLQMLKAEQLNPVREQAADVGRMLNGLKRSLRSKT